MWITNTDGLNAFCQQARAAGVVAVDTEFVWERTYYAQMGVVQLATSADDAVLVDAPAITDWTPLAGLLVDSSVCKILHDAQQDLMHLRHLTGADPKSIFDTRLASGFVGMKSTLSLADCLRATVGVDLPKTETRTDWLQRPLSEKQEEYALDDVRYMVQVREILLEGARQRGRENWVQDEMALLDDATLYEENDPRVQYLRVKGFGRLSGRQLAILRELAAWREEDARRRDTPRRRIVDDEALIALARNRPSSMQQLKSVRGLHPREAERSGRAILRAVEAGLAVSDEDCPCLPGKPEEDEARDARVDLALGVLKGVCLAEEMDPALVATRTDVAAFVTDGDAADPDTHRLLQGWRSEFAGQRLLAFLRGDSSLRINPATGLPQLG